MNYFPKKQLEQIIIPILQKVARIKHLSIVFPTLTNIKIQNALIKTILPQPKKNYLS